MEVHGWMHNRTNRQFTIARADVDCKGSRWVTSPPSTLAPGQTVRWHSVCESIAPVNDTWVSYRDSNDYWATTHIWNSYTGNWGSEYWSWPSFADFTVVKTGDGRGTASFAIVMKG
jgi:hypothetical protein